MKRETAAHLTNLFDMGYLITIDDAGPYSQGTVTSIGQEDYDEDHSPYVYSDDFFSDRPLEEVSISTVKVYKPINFLQEEPETQEEVYIGEEQEEQWLKSRNLMDDGTQETFDINND